MEGLAFSGSGNRLAFAIADVCYIVDVQFPTRITRLVGHSRPIMAVLLDHQGKTAVTASLDATIRVWDVESKEETSRLVQHNDGVLNLCHLDGGKTFASCGYDGKILKWSWTDWKLLGTVASAGSEVRRLVASHDGSLLAYSVSSDTRTVYVVSVASVKLLRTLRVDQALSSFCFSASGDSIVSAANYDDDSGVGVQIASTAIAVDSAARLLAKVPGEASCMRGYGDKIVFAGSDGALRMVDVNTKAATGFEGDATAWSSGIAFTGGSRCFVGTNAGFCNAVALASQEANPLTPISVQTAIPSPLFDTIVAGGRTLAVTGGSSGSARLYEEKDGKSAELAVFADGIVDCARFVEGGTGIVTSTRTGEVNHWRLRDKGNGSLTVELVKKMPQVHQPVGRSWQLKLTCGHWRGNDIVITGGLDARVFVRWLDTQEIVCEFRVKSPKLSPNLDRVDDLGFINTSGEVIAVCHGAVYRFRIEDESANVRRLELPDGAHVESVSWCQARGTIFLGLNSGAILEWDAEKGTEMQRLAAHRATVTDLVLSEDGKWLVSCGADGGLIVWALKARKGK